MLIGWAEHFEFEIFSQTTPQKFSGAGARAAWSVYGVLAKLQLSAVLQPGIRGTF
ncbi:MAG: hypothetical protein LUG19_11305 [Desulfovibrio sp.]|uniref:hypothetical protein n=1 Tax=Desulfovibrio sp. TaxID=885 RepID=UPI00258E1D15|nr:hypothetical protein [Desulfovibrio sp.]MCD7984817.1 hypothetical protein [Desulfovibrio sp.]